MHISDTIFIPDNEIKFHAVQSSGPGGQNVNKVATAIHLRFDIHSSSLPKFCKIRLLRLKDHRISQDGVIVIKARKFRTQEQNREDAIERLQRMIKKAMTIPKNRKPTKPTRNSQKKRLDLKKKHGQQKKLRDKTSIIRHWRDD